MSRWIEVNEFYDKMYEWVRIHGGIIRNEMQAILEATPSIDIVRCKECKYYNIYLDEHGCWKRCDLTMVGAEADCFCSWGERKSDE